jgi:hypothetical protein
MKYVIVFVMACLLGVAAFAVFGRTMSHEEAIMALAHAKVSSSLLSPTNAEFSDEHISKDGQTVCGWVSGVNAFGVRLAPVKYSYYYGGVGHEYVDIATDRIEYEYAVKHCSEAGL